MEAGLRLKSGPSPSVSFSQKQFPLKALLTERKQEVETHRFDPQSLGLQLGLADRRLPLNASRFGARLSLGFGGSGALHGGAADKSRNHVSCQTVNVQSSGGDTKPRPGRGPALT